MFGCLFLRPHKRYCQVQMFSWPGGDFARVYARVYIYIYVDIDTSSLKKIQNCIMFHPLKGFGSWRCLSLLSWLGWLCARRLYQ